MTNETLKYCYHHTFGLGYAQLTKYRKDSKDDLWMISFYVVETKSFFCTKHFVKGGEIWFVSDAEAKELKKKPAKAKRTKTVRKDTKNLSDLLDSLR